MKARRDIADEVFVYGCHNLGLGRPSGGGQVDMERHVVPMVRMALDLGIMAFDSAPLYRATLQLGQALVALGIEPETVQFQTKCLRYLGFRSPSAKEHQPDALTAGIPDRYRGLTDRWDTTPAGIESQICRERIEWGGDLLTGVAFHDFPDLEKQRGPLNWKTDVQPGVEFLKQAKAAGHLVRIGLGVKDIEFVHRFVKNEPGVLDYAGVTSAPTILGPMMKLISAAQDQKFEVTLMGILYGGAFTLTQDPAEAPPFIYNYEPAGPDELELMSRFYRACGTTPLLHLAAACAGILAANYPTTVTQIVVSTLTPSRLAETIRLVREVEVPAPVWAELKAAELIPRDFPTS